MAICHNTERIAIAEDVALLGPEPRGQLVASSLRHVTGY